MKSKQVSFLSEGGYREAVNRMLESKHPLDIAVAFWGWGADEMIGRRPEDGGSVRIVCNLMSGACNPDVIRKLLKKKNVKVKIADDLHAKVLVNSEMAIIGSANFSANGLGFEGSNVLGAWREAGLASDDEHVRRAASRWFNRMFKESEEISEKHLNKAEELWRRRRSVTLETRPKPAGTKLIANLPLEQLVGAEVYFAVFEEVEHLPSPAEDALKAARQNAGDDSLNCWVDWPDLPVDALIIDVPVKSGKARIADVWRRVSAEKISTGKGSIQLASRVDKVLGYKWGEQQRQALKRLCGPHLEKLYQQAEEEGFSSIFTPLDEVIKQARQK